MLTDKFETSGTIQQLRYVKAYFARSLRCSVCDAPVTREDWSLAIACHDGPPDEVQCDACSRHTVESFTFDAI